jgi:HK97 family phage prohead protease
VPVIFNHDWGSPDAHIGVAYARDMAQTDKGLLVKGNLDVEDNPVARQVHKLMRRRSLREFSFGYTVPAGGSRRASDGANELHEIDLVEVGPTLKGMNPATELHGVKSDAGLDLAVLPEKTRSPEYQTLKERARREIYALLTAPPEDAPAPKRGRSLVDRELRRQCDRIRLEAALGFDSELIDKLTNREAA